MADRPGFGQQSGRGSDTGRGPPDADAGPRSGPPLREQTTGAPTNLSAPPALLTTDP